MRLIQIFIAYMFFCGLNLNAQDIIEFKDKRKVEAAVVRITSEIIQYRHYDQPDGAVFEVNVLEVNQIKLENGKTYKVDHSPRGEQIFYTGNKLNVIKINFFQLLTKTTEIHYERSIRPGLSLEGSLAIMGIGFNSNQINRDGFFIKVGPKFIKQANSRKRIYRNAHILKGFYMKPELMVGYYNENYDGYYSYQNISTPIFSLNMVGGVQLVQNNVFALDIFIGHGLGAYSKNGADRGWFDFGIFPGTNWLTPESLSFTAGVKVGLLF